MSLGPLIGVAIALISILLGNIIEGGKISSLLGGPAALIVVGGTVGAGLVQYPMSDHEARASPRRGTLQEAHPATRTSCVDELVDYANRARKDGILALEKLAPNASDPFLAKALMMAVDGADSNALQGVHGDRRSPTTRSTTRRPRSSSRPMGGYSPTIGIIGAVLGLIHVMANLSDIERSAGHRRRLRRDDLRRGLANVHLPADGGRIKLQVRSRSSSRR
jgi:chemotaxis protein MotA